MESNYENIHFCQWLDIGNRSIYITMSKETEFISDIYEYAGTKQGKLLIYIFSIGTVDEEFENIFKGMKDDFISKNIITHNYKVSIDINAHEIIPPFEKLREEMKDEKKSFILNIVKEDKDNKDNDNKDKE